MMIRNRFVLKSIAVLLILLTLNNLFFPALSYALTAGPTAPEYTSFEPVDTTDMVNLATGDFTYNIPLLEVPGPEGGYPLSLSYHAGIQPGEEASWVGLGWTLNPGAINRTVNGYPDDHSGAKRTVTDTWEGGKRSTFSIGIGLPGASFGLQFSQDTYQGFGVGSNSGVGVNIGRLGIGVSNGAGPYGGAYASIGISAGVPIGPTGEGGRSAARLGGSVGVSTNFESVSTYAGAGVSINNETMLGASISSNGLKPRFSVAGNAINQVNSNAGHVTVDESGFSVPIPLGPSGAWLTLGYNYMRYYSNEESEVSTWGTLYPVWKEPQDNSFDSYALLDPDTEGGIVDNPQADKVLGGSMPAFDHYSVTGQGLSGSMQPYLFQNFNMYRQNIHKVDNKEDNLIEYKTNYTPYPDPLPVAFRFNNDFSNTAHLREDPVVDRTDNRFVRLDNDNTVKGSQGFNSRTGHLAGSKHVEYFTNFDINRGDAFKNFGFISYDKRGGTPSRPGISRGPRMAVKSSDVSDQVGGFMITNESGVTYHYSLPVYAYDEYIHSETIDDEEGNVENNKEHPHAYAYTWLLTAITGPDYVNRNPNQDNTIDEEKDWGYWVKFEYGKWAEEYEWRNPAIGMHKDIDRNTQNYSRGKKELYYLNAVQTRSHTALFVKELRADAKGVTDSESGGFDILKDQPLTYVDRSMTSRGGREIEIGRYNKMPISTLKLNAIHLLKNEDYQLLGGIEIARSSNTYNHSFQVSKAVGSRGGKPYERTISRTLHYGQRVVDINDVASIASDLREKSLRIVDFGHDYYLQPRTPNSYNSSGDMYELLTKIGDDSPGFNYSELGKLTLQNLSFLGKGGADFIPQMTFGYDDESTIYRMEISRSAQSGLLNGIKIENFQDSRLEEGEMLKFKHDNKIYLCQITRITGSSSAQARVVNRSIFTDFLKNTSVSATKSENYPYDQEAHDMWGYYKSDYVDLGNENLSRLTNAASARHIDAWSLKKIGTSLGAIININYASDTYRRPKLHYISDIPIANINQVSDENIEIIINTSIFSNARNIADLLGGIGAVEVKTLIAYPYTNISETICLDRASCESENKTYSFKYKILEADVFVKSASYNESSNEIVIYGNSASLYEALNKGEDTVNKETRICQEKVTKEVCDDDDTSEDNNIGTDEDDNPHTGSNDSGNCSQVTTHEDVICTDKRQRRYEETIIIGGNLAFSENYNLNGGGLRVEKVSTAYENEIHRTLYQYESEISNGITSYEPAGLNQDILTFPKEDEHLGVHFSDSNVKKSAEDAYHKVLYESFSNLLANAREVPPPGVVYERVTVTEETQIGNQAPVPVGGASVYTFQTFEENMIQRDTRPCEGCTNTQQGRALTFRDFSTRVGALKKVEQYGAQGQLLAETINHYLYDEADPARYKEALLDRYNGQGLISQVTNERRVVEIDGKDYDQVLLTAKEEYPTVIVGSTTINHKTGLTTSTRNLAFDFFSGVPAEVMSEDSYGNKYVSVTTPAYHLYEQMGPKVQESTNKHMLTQQAEQMTYKINPGFDPQAFPRIDYQPEGLVSASVQTWSDQIATLNASSAEQANIWRKHRSYVWTGESTTPQKDGTAPMADFALFDRWQYDGQPNEPSDINWEKQGEITLYDPYSHAREALDVNGDRAATQMDGEHRLVLATVANAAYHEFGYSGAEHLKGQGNGKVSIGPTARASETVAHTGGQSLLTPPGGAGFAASINLNPARSYRASVWVYVRDDNDLAGVHLIVDGNPVPEVGRLKAGAWYQFSWNFSGEKGFRSVTCHNQSSGTLYFDDFRVHPLDAAMISYVYDEKTDELTHILNTDNFYTRFEYDEMGRLVATFQEIQHPVEKQISKQVYHYQTRDKK